MSHHEQSQYEAEMEYNEEMDVPYSEEEIEQMEQEYFEELNSTLPF